MALKKFSISLEETTKARMEELAELNHRSLTGEINMAIDYYMGQIGGNGVHVQPIVHHEEPTRTIESNNITTITSFGTDEVEEF